ncbi:MAG: undecaprenyl-diphosphate phosphatase [Alphaproteobacteria bacterium]|jgi:undecaprenyl-diphosphatase|nr:undecaprenyl-diphosphate phosphatase [Alphaproteobacteria bacterium]
MTLLQLLVIAIVQGITEFIPVSSSAHLVLVPVVMGWPDQGLVIDVAVHLGTLAAVILYFRHDVWTIIQGGLRLIAGRWTPEARLTLQIAIASVPAFLAGFMLHEMAPTLFRAGGENPRLAMAVIAQTTLFFGLLLWAADRFRPTTRDVTEIGYGGALIVGLMQAIALIPGTSRAGITITAARLLGVSRTEAARFSLLLAIPVILGAGTLAGKDVYDAGDAQLGLDALIAAAFSFVAALITITLMMRLLRFASFLPFVIYRVLLGLFLTYYVFTLPL